MIDPLYQKEILRLAAEAFGAGDLPDAAVSVKIKNPMCGDQIKLDLRLNDHHVAAVAHETRACVLCQASASLMAGLAEGQSEQSVQSGRTAVAAMLSGTGGRSAKDGAPLEGTHWASYSVFTPVRDHANRHRCVLLPFDALIRAFEEARN